MSSYSPKRACSIASPRSRRRSATAPDSRSWNSFAQGERSVEGLADRTGLSVANASQHLRLMQRRRCSRPDATASTYSIGSAIHQSCTWSPRCASLRRASTRQHVTLSAATFGSVTTLRPCHAKNSPADQGRPRDSTRRPAGGRFAAGHLPRAINIPLRELSRRCGNSRRAEKSWLIARGPYCVLAFEAVAFLRQRGWKVRRLEDGFPEWKAAGLPVWSVSRVSRRDAYR